MENKSKIQSPLFLMWFPKALDIHLQYRQGNGVDGPEQMLLRS